VVSVCQTSWFGLVSSIHPFLLYSQVWLAAKEVNTTFSPLHMCVLKFLVIQVLDTTLHYSLHVPYY
jgi:hypothetical protein